MNCIRLVVGALLALAAPTTIKPAAAEAYAQWPRPCRGDIGRICRDVGKEEDKVILTCLQENQVRLGQPCRKLLQSYGHVPEGPGKRR